MYNFHILEKESTQIVDKHQCINSAGNDINSAGNEHAQLHLKIKAFHSIRSESPPLYSNNEVTQMLIPRQSYLNKLDLDHVLDFREVCKIVYKSAMQYVYLIIACKTESEYKFDQALNVHEHFQILHRENVG